MPNYTPSDSFRQASMAEKIAFLSSKSPSFAKSSPQEQAQYINEILGNKNYTPFEQSVNTTGAQPSDDSSGPISRYAKSAVGAVLGIPSAIGHAVFDPLTPEEEADFQGHTRIPGEVAVERLTGARDLVNAGRAYANPATRPSLDQIKSVLPEALGTGTGAYLGGKLLGKTAGFVSDKVGPGIARGLMDESGTQPKPIVKLALGNERAGTLADIADPDRVAARNAADADVARRTAASNAAQDAMPQSVPSQTRYGQFLADDTANREPVPVNQSPYYTQNRAAAAADKLARKPVPLTRSPNMSGDNAASYTAGKQGTTPQAGETNSATSFRAGTSDVPDPNTVLKLPPPKPPIPGVPNNMGSVPRESLFDAADRGVSGAGPQLQSLGQNVLYVPEEYPGPRSSTSFDATLPPPTMPAVPSGGGVVAPPTGPQGATPPSPATQNAPAFILQRRLPPTPQQ